MAISFAAVNNGTWNFNTTTTSYSVGNIITVRTAGRLYVAHVNGSNEPASMTSNAGMTWTKIHGATWSSRGTAVFIGIATSTGSNWTTTVTFGSSSVGCFGGITEVSGITDDGANGVNLIDAILYEHITGTTHSFDFGSLASTTGVYMGAMAIMASDIGSPEDFTPNSASWTQTVQLFRAGIPSLTLPYFDFEAHGKLNPAQPTGGSWISSEDSYGVALAILETAPEEEIEAYWGINAKLL